MSIIPLPPNLDEFPEELQRYFSRHSLDDSVIPEDLRDLIPWAKFWSIGDDVGRERVMRSISTISLKAFVDSVWPRRDRINVWYQEAMRTMLPQHDVEACGFCSLSQALFEAYVMIYPHPLAPAIRSEVDENERDAALRSLMKILESGPAGLAISAGGSGGAPFEKLDPEVQDSFRQLSESLEKVAKEIKQMPDYDKGMWRTG